MYKILYCVSTLKKCGPINVLYNTVKYLDRTRFDVCIMTLSAEKANTRIQEFRDLNCKIFCFNFSKLESLYKPKFEIEKIIKAEKIDVIHTHGIRADFLAASLKNTPTCSTLHTYPFYDYMLTYGKITGYLMAKVHISTLKKIVNPNACSQSISGIILKNHKLNINSVQNGVDLANYSRPTKLEKAELRQKLSLPDVKKIFVSVGHLSPLKDPITIIKAFNNLSDDFCVLFLGRGKLEQTCQDLIQDKQKIRLIGFVNNVSDYLKAADYFVSASLVEGLPNTVMEALATGLPCVLSDINPHREILDYYSEVGELFTLGNALELSEKIQKITGKDYAKLSDHAFDLVKQNLSAEIMSRNYQKVYLKLVGAEN